MSDDAGADPERWVDRHGDGLYRYALLRLRSPDLAADAVQETFMEALRCRAAYAGRSSERTWLVGILRHKVIDQLRRSGRESPLEDDEENRSFFNRSGHWRLAPKRWADAPADALETGEFWEVLNRCLSRLPDGVASAFLLRELDGLEASQVQETLGITPANFWKRLHRARELLRRCLEIGWFGRSSEDSSPQPLRHARKGPVPR